MTLLDYQKAFVEHSPCDEGREAFLRCTSRMEAYDLAASPQGTDFLLRSMSEGWGPSAADLRKVFYPYINGRRTYHHVAGDREIGIQIWCGADRIDVPEKVRCIVLVGCRGTVVVKPWQTVRIVVSHDSAVSMDCDDSCLVYVENCGGTVLDPGGNCRIRNKETK